MSNLCEVFQTDEHFICTTHKGKDGKPFVVTDVKDARKHCLHHNLPKLGYVCKSMIPTGDKQDKPCGRCLKQDPHHVTCQWVSESCLATTELIDGKWKYKCEILNENGQPCHKTFACRKYLTKHQIKCHMKPATQTNKKGNNKESETKKLTHSRLL